MPRPGWLAVGALLGALVAETASRPLLGVLLVVCVLFALGAAWRRHPALAAALAAALLVGGRAFVPGVLAAEAPPPPLIQGERAWIAEVASVGSANEGRQRAVLIVHSSGARNGNAAMTDRAVPTWRVYGQLPRYPTVVPGDRFAFRGRLEPAPNDGGFGEYLARSGITATTRISVLELVIEGDVSPVERLRRDAGEVLGRTLPAPQAGLAAGIVIGLRDLVDRDVAADFTTSGLSHVVAISGWNIAIVGAVVASLTRSVPRRRRSVAILITVVAYTLLAGASASVVRAALMASVVLIARESGRRGGASAALGLATVAMLLIEPGTVLDAGFQLSVVATAGLLAWSAGLTARLRRISGDRLPAWLIESLGVSLAAQAATLPIVLLNFGRLSLVAPLANLVAAPLVIPVMFVSVVALAAGAAVAMGAPFLVAVAPATAGWAILGALIGIARLGAALPFASVELVEPWNVVAAVASGGAILMVTTPRTRRLLARLIQRVQVGRRAGRRSAPGAASAGAGHPAVAAAQLPRGAVRVRATAGSSRVMLAGLAGLGAIAVTVLVVLITRPDGRMRMTVLDVGQGDAILLEGPRGGRLLVDGGPDPDRLLMVLDARLPPWDRRVDLVVLTHPHEDHVAGLPVLLSRYNVGAIAEPGMRGPGPGYEAFDEALRHRGQRPRLLAAGDRLELDGASIDVRWPLPDTVPVLPQDDGTGINNVSIVLDICYGERRFLLAGDAEEEVDPALLAARLNPDGRRLDVLKVAHHGSATATTDPFLTALEPRVAVISAGVENRYGHPAPATLARLQQYGADTYRTDLHGSVTIATDGHDLQVSAGGGRQPRERTALALPVPRIAWWPSPLAVTQPPSFVSSRPPTGSWLIPPSPPRWRQTWGAVASRWVCGWTAPSSSQRPSSMTSTRS